MNRKFSIHILVTLLLMTFCVRADAQNIQVEARLQQYTIRIGDQTKLFLSVHQPVAAHVNFPKVADTITGKVQVISAGKLDTAFDKNDRTLATITQNYTITSFDPGTYTIPPFAFGASGGVLKTNELTLQVETVKVDTTKAIYDIKQPLTVSYTWWDWLKDNWVWVALGLAGILVIIGLILYFRKRPKKQPVVEVVKPGLPPHTIALSKLNELRDKKLWQQGHVKEYHIELSDVLREYLEKRYLIKTHEKTTDEIFASLKRLNISSESKGSLLQILTLADLVKFAKEKPSPAENEQVMDSAISFVSNTQPVPEPAKLEGGKGNV